MATDLRRLFGSLARSLQRKDVSSPPEEELSTIERACLHTLQIVANRDCDIRHRVVIGELTGNNDRSVVLDFVLYGKASGRPLCALLFQSEKRSSASIESRLAQNGIALFTLPRRSSYAPLTMRELLKDFVHSPLPTGNRSSIDISAKRIPKCSRCQNEMVRVRSRSDDPRWKCPQCDRLPAQP